MTKNKTIERRHLSKLVAERYATLKRIISKCGFRISNRLSYHAEPSNLRQKATIYHGANLSLD
jgi:hypothetical protein